MKYIHVKNLEKYHPGYQDRNLIWCKIHFRMISGDPDFEMLDELDQWRFVKLIMLELQSRGPIPLDQKFLERKGFNFKKRSMSLTIDGLHEFIEVCNTQEKECVTHGGESVATSLSTSLSISSLLRREKPENADEVVLYFKELGSGEVSANRFFDYFESNGWKVGRHSMRDWKAAARNWIGRDREKKPSSPDRMKARAESIAKEIAHL